MNIYPVSPDYALSNWTLISSYLTRALEHGQGESTLTDYMRKILNGYAQCWGVVKDDKLVGVGLTEIMQYSQQKTLHIIAFSGDNFEEQSGMINVVKQYAIDNGCKAIEQYGRKGWAKMLPKYIPEFKECYTVMRIDL